MRGGRPVGFTAKEFKTLKFMIQNAGRVISRNELLNEVWGYHDYPHTRTVDTRILSLRNKLERDPPILFIFEPYGVLATSLSRSRVVFKHLLPKSILRNPAPLQRGAGDRRDGRVGLCSWPQRLGFNTCLVRQNHPYDRIALCGVRRISTQPSRESAQANDAMPLLPTLWIYPCDMKCTGWEFCICPTSPA
jgi:hypothetical protein